MNKPLLFILLLALPGTALAQTPTQQPTANAPFNAPTLAVLLANRPAHIEQSKWLELMLDPVQRSLYPLRVPQAMLDTLDGRLLDRRFNYIMGR
jgi:hypothetical protein